MFTKETLLLVLAAALCYLLYRRISRPRDDDSRAAKLMKKYKELTREKLNDTDDDELVEAVVSHVLALAAENRRPDPQKELAFLPQPYTVVYSIWAVGKELARTDYKGLTHTATKALVEPAVDGLPVIGAPATAAALAELKAAFEAKEDVTEATAAYHKAVEQECPLTLCVSYIRDHIPELLGEEPEETPALPETEETTDEG
ncbi:MAG: hypothetical protein E7527_01825 [Ruminococcaceae bacterium]|nr:hypothetical protein [Oscillospiraceae bacterium]